MLDSKISYLNKILFFLFASIWCYAQSQSIHYYSDHFQGGVTGGGYNPGNFDFNGQIDLNIPTGSTIRKAFFFASATKHVNYTDFPEPRTVLINGQTVNISMDDALFNNYIIKDQFHQPQYSMRTVVKDISQLTLTSVTSITPPFQVLPPFYWEYYILVLYENTTLPLTVVDVFINTLDADSSMGYSLNPTFVIDASSDVALAINTSHFCDTIQDGSYVFVEGNVIGLIGGDDYNVPTLGGCAGTTGGFYYEGNSIFGLGDDTPDEFMTGPDVLANIQNYVVNNQQVNVNFVYQSNFGPESNPINQLFLSYTTPCAPFDVSVPSDTTLCLGSTLQLNATGGQSYEWVPSTGLSCTTCHNPVFTADSSMFYTVRIWNNDSCSVVRPLKINVRPQPIFGAITATPSECGTNTGTVILNASPNNGIVANWQEVGGAAQTNNVFQNLSAGNHTFFFTDTNGCQSADTTVFIGEVNSTVASFTVSPQSGAAPLSATITNTSQNATNYEWFLNGVSQGSSFTTSTFGVSGSYEIMLVAWQHAPSCADTAYQTIVVFDSLVVTLPNVFTPNFDGTNDFFTLTANQNVNYELLILNRWGNVVFEENSNLVAGVTKNVWGGTDYKSAPTIVTDGVYFVKMRVVTENGEVLEVEDFVTVVK